jgi:TonB family protein
MIHAAVIAALLISHTQERPEKKQVLTVRLSPAAGTPQRSVPTQQPRAAKPAPAVPPAAVEPSLPAKPALVPPPAQQATTPPPKRAAASESLFGQSNLPVAKTPQPAAAANPPTAKPAPATPATAPASSPSAREGVETATPVAAGNPLAEPRVGTAGVTGLEGGPFPFTLYLERMIGRISENWLRPATADGARAQVYFVIERNGTIRDAEVRVRSGNSTFDRAALRAVIDSSPLPPLPHGYTGTYLGVHLTFH